jgi:hypothetical protein
MFILTTAPQAQRAQDIAITQRTLTIYSSRPRASPRPHLREQPASLQTPPPTHPFLYPTMSNGNPRRRAAPTQGERYVIPSPHIVNRFSADFVNIGQEASKALI